MIMDRQMGANSEKSLGMNPQERKTGLRGTAISSSNTYSCTTKADNAAATAMRKVELRLIFRSKIFVNNSLRTFSGS
jgi:hypothetical protein